MYQLPTIFDFQRNLDTLIHSGEQEARAEAARIKSEFAARGIGSSTGVITAAIGRFDQIHKDILERAMRLIGEFANRNAALSPAVLAGAARPRFHNFSTMLLGTVPPAGFPAEAQRFRGQYKLVFQQRLDGALRDIEIGFIGGRNMSGSHDQDVQGNAFSLLKAIEHEMRGLAGPVALDQIGDLQMTVDEAKAAFHYLKGRGLIDANFGVFYAARLSAAGHDAIKEAESNPTKSISEFPAITHNYYMTIHSMTGSNVQQGTTNSSINETQTITAEQLTEEVRNLFEQLDRGLSMMPAAIQEQTREALAELQAATTVPGPDVSRVRRGLESLKHIMEHATGHLIATGALTAIAQLLARLPI
jgi:hypothetical protein